MMMGDGGNIEHFRAQMVMGDGGNIEHFRVQMMMGDGGNIAHFRACIPRGWAYMYVGSPIETAGLH